MDRLEAMAVFRTVVRTGSLSGAGRTLGMPLATVSRKLSDLEAHLKSRLLRRSTRKLELTDAGAAYLAACQRILDAVEEAERTAAGEFSAPRGELVVTAPFAFGSLHVVPVVSEFLRAFGDVQVRLLLGDRPLDLIEEHLDLAVRIGELPDSRLVAARVGAARVVVSSSVAYLEENGRPPSPASLAQHQLVFFDALVEREGWTFNVGGKSEHIALHPRLRVNTAEAAVAAAVAGAGLVRTLDYQVAAPVREGALEIVLREFEPPARPINLLYLHQGRMPLKARAFLDFASARLRERLS